MTQNRQSDTEGISAMEPRRIEKTYCVDGLHGYTLSLIVRLDNDDSLFRCYYAAGYSEELEVPTALALKLLADAPSLLQECKTEGGE